MVKDGASRISSVLGLRDNPRTAMFLFFKLWLKCLFTLLNITDFAELNYVMNDAFWTLFQILDKDVQIGNPAELSIYL